MTAPSYEQLAALVAAQERIIAQLQARIAEQDARIAELERLRHPADRDRHGHPGAGRAPAPGDCSGRCGYPDVSAGELGEDFEGAAAVLGGGR